jgi:hypothetical protein
MINFIKAILRCLDPNKEDKLEEFWLHQYRVGRITHDLSHLDAQTYADEQTTRPPE